MTALSPTRSLQRSEALARAELLRPTSYDVTLDLAADEASFASRTVLRFASAAGETFLDLKPTALASVRLDGAALDVGLLERGRFPLTLTAGEHELEVVATMPFRNDGEGLHRSVDPADGRHYVYGMSFMDAAPTIFACFDQPDLKAPYTFHVTAPAEWTVLGNAPAARTGTEGGVSRWEFETSPPLSTYFVTIVAGPYHVLHDEHDGIRLGLSARASLAGDLDADADELFTLTKQCFDEYHRLFGIRYPFGDYHQAFVPEFNAGAMENPGCVTLRDPLIFSSRVTRGMRIQRATTVAHEMAHQWFGNLVTPAWWDDLWLNESFAEYMGNRVTASVTEYHDAWADNSYARRQWGLTADLRPSTHPVAGNGAVDASAALQDFDGISYAKGSAILRQLAASLGDQVFFDGVVDHFTRHRFGNATMHDLFASWEGAARRSPDAGGRVDLSSFAADWLRTAGPDRLSLDRAAGLIRRTPPAPGPAQQAAPESGPEPAPESTQRSHTFRVARHDAGGWQTETVRVDSAETPYLAGASDAVLLDPYDDTWAVSVPDPVTVAALPGLMDTITDDGLRAGVWNNLRSGFREGLIAPSEVIAVAEAGLPIEDTEDTPRRTRAWLFGWVVPLAPEGSLARLHAAALDKLAGTAPGSEPQLAAFRAAVRSATSADGLRAWLARTPSGIDLDTALRWSLLVRLAELGATARTELRAAYDAEPTGDARVAHTQALCALPDAEAKAYAWSVFTAETDLPNYEVLAAGAGMWAGGPAVADLVAPYVDRYFTELPGTVGARSGWVLADAAEAFFPAVRPSADVLAQARRLATAETLDPSLRRRLIDCADDLAHRLVIAERYPA
ncbi:MAG: aminopeptidase N [Nocardioides sp.]|uniref:aminopeptidase N n=1 Tax=Nocardioides sp. TaxID=35761 RepID=UPI0039E2D9F0